MKIFQRIGKRLVTAIVVMWVLSGGRAKARSTCPNDSFNPGVQARYYGGFNMGLVNVSPSQISIILRFNTHEKYYLAVRYTIPWAYISHVEITANHLFYHSPTTAASSPTNGNTSSKPSPPPSPLSAFPNSSSRSSAPATAGAFSKRSPQPSPPTARSGPSCGPGTAGATSKKKRPCDKPSRRSPTQTPGSRASASAASTSTAGR